MNEAAVSNCFFDTLPNCPLDAARKKLWFAAAYNCTLADPCCSEPAWQMSFHRAKNRNNPVFMLFSHGNALCLTQETGSQGTYLLPLESSWFYASPLIGSDPFTLFFTALEYFDEFYKDKPFPDIIFGGMQPHHYFSNQILLYLSTEFSFYRLSHIEVCCAQLDGSVDTFLRNRSQNFRQKLKKACRKAKEIGVTYERCIPESADEANSAYERMLAVEARSWKGREQNGILHPETTLFYRYLLEDVTQDRMARIIFAQKDGLDIGFIFGQLSNRIYRGQQFSYDADFATYSIGNTLQFEQIKWLCEERCRRYDMGAITGPKMGYKAHWTEIRMPLESWLLRRRSL